MKIVALLAVYNEALYLERCLEHLRSNGIQAYILDNGSTDGSGEIARRYLNSGVIGVETVPRYGVFELEGLLKRKEELAGDIGADWYIHHDADEIRQAPNPHKTLAEGIMEADGAGYNAVNFDEFVFLPMDRRESYENRDYVEGMRYYYFFEPKPLRRVNAWKNLGQQVDLRRSAGHRVRFRHRRVYPRSFILRHYMALSWPHVLRKYCERQYARDETRKKGWRSMRYSVRPDQLALPARNELCEITADNRWDCTRPWRIHALFRNVPIRPVRKMIRRLKATVEFSVTPSPMHP